MRSKDRPLLPRMNKSTLKIPGVIGQQNRRNGYDNKMLAVSFSFTFNTLEEKEQMKRELARWLKGKGVLRFDDEPDKYYEAEVLNNISFNQEYGYAVFQVVFECYPCAYGDTKLLRYNIKNTGHKIGVDYRGNYETPQQIIIRNDGSNTINGLKLIIHAEKE